MTALRILTAVTALAALPSAVSAQASHERQQTNELQLMPERPKTGDRITVEYMASADLAGEPKLVLRARLRTVAAGIGVHQQSVTELERSATGRFHGAFELPDSVVYAVFAVEDRAGRRVDHHGEKWELVVHGKDGRPLRDALNQRVRDLAERDKRLAYEAAHEFVRLYPTHVTSWMALYLYGDVPGAAANKDSIRDAHTERLRAFSQQLESVSRPAAMDMTNIVFYGSWLGDTTISHHWRSRLIRDYPTHAFAVQQRVFALSDTHRSDASALMNAYEGLWQEVGTVAPQLPFSAFNVVQRLKNPEAMLRWGRRLEQMDSSFVPFIAQALIEHRELREEALARMRQQIHRLDNPADSDRPLTWTRDEYRNQMQRGAGIWLGRVGTVLYEMGETQAALDTLERAVKVWNVDSFRMIADLRLSMGDTAAAVPVLARVAADPATASSFSDSVRARIGKRFEPDAWARALKAADQELRAYVWAQATSRGLRSSRVPLHDANGQPHTFQAGTGRVTLVALWSRYCQPSYMQLRQLNDVAARLMQQGVPVLAVTDEKPSGELNSFLSSNGYRFPVFHDVEEAARQAFATTATPSYLVLDAAGRIRFESHVLDDVIRQVAVLREHI